LAIKSFQKLLNLHDRTQAQYDKMKKTMGVVLAAINGKVGTDAAFLAADALAQGIISPEVAAKSGLMPVIQAAQQADKLAQAT